MPESTRPSLHRTPKILPIAFILLTVTFFLVTADQPACDLPGDTPPCGEVTLAEVIDHIILWSNDQAELEDVIDLIDIWANPATTTLTTTSTTTSTSLTTTTCLGEGETIFFEIEPHDVCCPGLTMIREASIGVDPITDEDYCIYTSCHCYVCTNCSNGICEEDKGENWCNCLDDCPDPENNISGQKINVQNHPTQNQNPLSIKSAAIKPATDSITLRVYFPELEMVEGPTYDDVKYDSIILQGAYRHGKPGIPVMPFENVRILVPQRRCQ